MSLLLLCMCCIKATTQLDSLSDEFNRTCSLNDWSDVNTIEQWNASHLEVIDIDQSNDDRLTLMPHTTSWYQNYRSNLLFKEVTGDFMCTSNVIVSNRAGNGIPSSNFSLTGMMARIPTEITPATWSIGLEDYIFLSIGRANSNSSWQFERKSTTNSNSQLLFQDISGSEATIRMLKVDHAFIVMLKIAGQTDFQILHRYSRPDMADTTLQVGLVAYTDYNKVNTYRHDTSFYNSHIITDTLPNDPGIPARAVDPDVIGQFDFVRFADVNLPPAYIGLDFSDDNAVTDAEILTLFGAPSTSNSEQGWKIWKGSNNNWSDPNNWSASTLPISQDSILIPNCGCTEVFYPTLSSGTSTYSSLKIEPGGQLTINSGDNLFIDINGSNSVFINEGNINNSGTISIINTNSKSINNTGIIDCINTGIFNIIE